MAVNELLDLFELMDSEDSPHIASVGASFLSEASRDAGESLWHIFLLEPLSLVEGRDRLLRGRCEVAGLVLVIDLVEVLCEVTELAG